MQAQSAEPDAQMRLKIGVTGHRRLSDADELADRVDEVLDIHIPELLDAARPAGDTDFPRPELVYTVITPLAEGADRRVAQTIMKRSDARVEVILPLTVSDYVEDFHTSESLGEFKQLLALADRSVSLRDTPLAEGFAPSELAEARVRAYEDTGRCLVDCCDVLIAVWDGKRARGRGGTAGVVRYARDIGRPVVVIRAQPPYEIVVHTGRGIRTEPVAGFDELGLFEVSASEV